MNTLWIVRRRTEATSRIEAVGVRFTSAVETCLVMIALVSVPLSRSIHPHEPCCSAFAELVNLLPQLTYCLGGTMLGRRGGSASMPVGHAERLIGMKTPDGEGERYA
jgi:hypothetical protein